METTFPDRHYLLINFILIISMLTIFDCGSKKKYPFEPVSVKTKGFVVDSSYTIIEVIPTGNSDKLFCGKKEDFDSYSILKFDSIPAKYDSIFIQFKADSARADLKFYKVTREWYEDSIYGGEDIGSLIDTLEILKETVVNSENPMIILEDPTLINALDNFGVAIHSDSFYSFSSREKDEAKLILYESDSTYYSSCIKDLYIVQNENIFSDSSLMVGRGLSVQAHIFVPIDSLPNSLLKNRDNLSRASLLFEVEGPLSFDIAACDTSGNEYLYLPLEGDTIEFELAGLLKADLPDEFIPIKILAIDEVGGIGVVRLRGGELRLMWAEISE